ncbi:chemotaxis protein, partial [Pseudomonas sp. ODNR1LW]|nr:chemotaxis protein [Pseudomonas sp. ODNR1LW]
SDVVQAAKGDAETSGVIVRDAVEAMQAIEGSSSEISQIIGVIDEIAFQTNLLALNAGVEAARAGEAGRGFAVVASEVRALAQRSAEAAKEIKTLISTSTDQVGAGVKLVGQTGEALQRIVDRVAEIDGLVADIAASAQEQAIGLAQVNTAVNHMDQVTQQNAAMVEQSTAASQSLAQEADALQASVGQFQVGEAGRGPSAVKAERPARSDAGVSALKTLGRGGAAPAPSAAPVEDAWEEF